MADWPDSIFDPRTIENMPGVVYDADKTQVLFAEDINAITDEIIAIEENMPTADAVVGVTDSDTAPDYLDGKLQGDYRIDKSVVSQTGDETMLLSVNRQLLTDKRLMQILAHDISPLYLAEVGLPFSLVYDGTIIYFGFKDSDGMWAVLITDIATDSYSGVKGESGAYKEWQPEFCAYIKTGNDALTSGRLWVGLFSDDPSQSDDPDLDMAGFRYDTSVDGDNFVAVLRDGTTINEIDTGVAVEEGTAYKMYIKTDGVSFYFYIDDELVATSSTNAPTASVELFPYAIVTNLFEAPIVGAQLLEISRIQLLYN